MNENHNKENKPKVIGLKGVSSTVKQSFSHGRSKSVVVETKKKKVFFTKKTPEIEKKQLERQCIKRMLKPDDISKAVLFFASDQSSGCSAQNYVVDGGIVN